MGKIHRYYTKDDMRLLECAGRLLEVGVTLEEIKAVVPEMLKAREKSIEIRGEAVAEAEILPEEVSIATIVERVIQNNNILLEQGITEMVTESLKKEVSYLLLAKDQVEEERFKKLDTLIRQQQTLRKDSSKRSIGLVCKDILGIA